MAEFGESSCRRFLHADREALRQMVVKYSDGLVRYAYSIVHSASAAEEIAEDSFAVLYMKHKSFPDEQRLRAYLYRIVRSRAVDYLRWHKKTVPLEDVENVLSVPGPEEEYDKKLRSQTLYRAMQELPVQYREVLSLCYLEGFALPQAERILGKSRKQLYNLLARAKASLRQILEREGITHENL